MKQDDVYYYRQLPKEIIAVIKEEIKKQKGKYKGGASLIADLRDGGFNWIQSSQGFDFWHEVLSKERFDHFFERYPKPVVESEEDFKVTKFTSIPDASEVKIGDKFKVVSAISLSGELETCYFNQIGVKAEDIVILIYNDNTCCPKFQIPSGDHEFIDWGCLAPYQEVKEVKEKKQKSVKLTSKKDESNFSLFIPGISPAITPGTTCRGVAVQCSGEKITVGGGHC